MAHMGVGYASGKDKAEAAADMAISSPLLETSITGAKAVIINICASNDLLYEDAEFVSTMIEKAAHPDAAIFWGLVFNDNMNDEIQVTVIATGFDEDYTGKGRLEDGNTPAGSQPAAPAKDGEAQTASGSSAMDPNDPFIDIMNLFNDNK